MATQTQPQAQPDFVIALTNVEGGVQVDISAKQVGDSDEPPESEARAIVTWIAQHWSQIRAEAQGIKTPFRRALLGPDGKPMN